MGWRRVCGSGLIRENLHNTDNISRLKPPQPSYGLPDITWVHNRKKWAFPLYLRAREGGNMPFY